VERAVELGDPGEVHPVGGHPGVVQQAPQTRHVAGGGPFSGEPRRERLQPFAYREHVGDGGGIG